MWSWSGRTVVLGVTGGIAAYKAAELASTLRQRGAEVRAVMTAAACEFVTPLTFRELTGFAAATDLFAPPAGFEVQHVAYAERADVVAVVPATANTIAKLAHGLADNLLTSIVLATRKPVLLAPAMNTGMYENPATRANLALLRERGVAVVGPATGRLLCGSVGAGRLAPLEDIVFALEKLLGPGDCEGLRVLVTAGGTREELDPVRFLGNRSSGRMGVALARVFAMRGAEVTLVAGTMEVPAPPGIEPVAVQTTADLGREVLARLPDVDVIVMAAAPADFRPAVRSGRKLKREEGLSLSLAPTEDIAAAVGEKKTAGQTLVIFAAETEDLVAHARAKLFRKRADLVAANDVTLPGGGFGAEKNQLHLLTASGERPLPLLPKDEAAWAVADAVLSLRAGRGL